MVQVNVTDGQPAQRTEKAPKEGPILKHSVNLFLLVVVLLIVVIADGGAPAMVRSTPTPGRMTRSSSWRATGPARPKPSGR